MDNESNIAVSGFKIVMGAGSTLSDNAPPLVSTPILITNQTNERQYRDSLNTWEEIIRSVAHAEKKMLKHDLTCSA